MTKMKFDAEALGKRGEAFEWDTYRYTLKIPPFYCEVIPAMDGHTVSITMNGFSVGRWKCKEKDDAIRLAFSKLEDILLDLMDYIGQCEDAFNKANKENNDDHSK